MSIHRRRYSLQAAAPPLEDDNLLSEILLRLPPEPSSLPRASAVCKPWRRLVSDPRFIRRFRRHHPPLLGFFTEYAGYGGISFQPTLEAPNRVVPGRFSLQQGRDFLIYLGCHHGLMLMLCLGRKQALVWDPVTGDQYRIALPQWFDVEYGTEYKSWAGIRAAGDVHFEVALVMAAREDELHTRLRGCVYSSKTRLWGNLISTLTPTLGLHKHGLFRRVMHSVLVGDSLYWLLIGESSGILEFDFERQSLAVIRLPMDMLGDDYQLAPAWSLIGRLTFIRAEGGDLGFLIVSRSGLSAQLWRRKTNCDIVASWELGRTIDLHKLLSLNSVEERRTLRIVGFAECNNVVFLLKGTRLLMLHLESLQFKEALQADYLGWCQPFECVYAPGYQSTPAASLNQVSLERTELITLNQKAVPNEDTLTPVHSDAQSLEKTVGPAEKQRSARKLSSRTRSRMIGSPISYAHDAPLTRSRAHALSISTPESLKMKKTKSGRVVVPALDPGSERIVYNTDGMISGVSPVFQSPLRGGPARKRKRKAL